MLSWQIGTQSAPKAEVAGNGDVTESSQFILALTIDKC